MDLLGTQHGYFSRVRFAGHLEGVFHTEAYRIRSRLTRLRLSLRYRLVSSRLAISSPLRLAMTRRTTRIVAGFCINPTRWRPFFECSRNRVCRGSQRSWRIAWEDSHHARISHTTAPTQRIVSLSL